MKSSILLQTRLEPSLLSGRITSRLLYLKDIGLVDFMKRIQMDRVYRSFESGILSTSSPDSRCSGYLKDRSVSIKFINSLVKAPAPVSVEVGRRWERLQVGEFYRSRQLKVEHLRSILLLLVGNQLEPQPQL